MDGYSDGELEFEHCALRGSSYSANGHLGQKEGVSVQERVRGKVSEKAIFVAAANLVRDTVLEELFIGCLFVCPFLHEKAPGAFACACADVP